MGRVAGLSNYKNGILLDVIEQLMPKGQVGWQAVADRYQIVSGETIARAYDDIRRHFIEKLCNNFKKPTGDTKKKYK